jgi:hypothetical protein
MKFCYLFCSPFCIKCIDELKYYFFLLDLDLSRIIGSHPQLLLLHDGALTDWTTIPRNTNNQNTNWTLLCVMCYHIHFSSIRGNIYIIWFLFGNSHPMNLVMILQYGNTKISIQHNKLIVSFKHCLSFHEKKKKRKKIIFSP